MATRSGKGSKGHLVRIRRRGIEIARTFDTKTEADQFRGEMLKKIRDQADLGHKERRLLAEGIERYLDEGQNNPIQNVSHRRNDGQWEVQAMRPFDRQPLPTQYGYAVPVLRLQPL